MDITSTWSGMLPTLLYIYRNVDAACEGAIAELERMAVLADRYVEAVDAVTLNAVDDPMA
jgi:hypothetical protein